MFHSLLLMKFIYSCWNTSSLWQFQQSCMEEKHESSHLRASPGHREEKCVFWGLWWVWQEGVGSVMTILSGYWTVNTSMRRLWSTIKNGKSTWIEWMAAIFLQVYISTSLKVLGTSEGWKAMDGPMQLTCNDKIKNVIECYLFKIWTMK